MNRQHQIRKSPSAPSGQTILTEVRQLYYPLHLDKDLISPDNKLISLYKSTLDSPLTQSRKLHGDSILQSKKNRLLQIANQWNYDFFELAQQCIDSCFSENKIQLAFNRLEVYLGPKVYKIQKEHREAFILRQFEKWRAKARFELWAQMAATVLTKKQELDNKARGNRHTWFVDLFSYTSLHIIADQLSRFDFLEDLANRVFLKWNSKIRMEYENEHIDLIVTNLIYQGCDEEKIKQTVKYPLSTQFGQFLSDIEKDFFKCDCVKKFSNTGNVRVFHEEIQAMQERCKNEIMRYDIKPQDNQLVERLNIAIEDYKAKAIAWIEKDTKESKDAPKFYHNQEAKLFVDQILKRLKMKKNFKEEDDVVPLVNLRGFNKQSLMALAVSKYDILTRPLLKEKFFTIIELFYEHGGAHEFAYGKRDHIHIPEASIEYPKLSWKFISLEISNIPVYCELESAIKKTLINYCRTIPPLLESNCFTRVRHDWHGLKRTKRLLDIQELAYALLKSCMSFNDSIVYILITTLRARAHLRVDDSDLYDKLNENVIRPLFAKFYTYFAQMTVDSSGTITLTASTGSKLQDDNMELRKKNADVHKKLQETSDLIKVLQSENNLLTNKFKISDLEEIDINEEDEVIDHFALQTPQKFSLLSETSQEISSSHDSTESKSLSSSHSSSRYTGPAARNSLSENMSLLTRVSENPRSSISRPGTLDFFSHYEALQVGEEDTPTMPSAELDSPEIFKSVGRAAHEDLLTPRPLSSEGSETQLYYPQRRLPKSGSTDLFSRGGQTKQAAVVRKSGSEDLQQQVLGLNYGRVELS